MNYFPAFPADEPLTETLDPGIYVEPKDKLDRSENLRQGEWVSFMRKHVPGCLVFAIPNGTNIRSKAGRAKVKREGLHAGFPDNGVLWADGHAYPEWKNGKGDPTDNQIETLNWMNRRGIPVAVVRTTEGCLRWLRSVGAPVHNIDNHLVKAEERRAGIATGEKRSTRPVQRLRGRHRT